MLVELCDQDPAFLYGLGITYFHFSAYQWYVLFMLQSYAKRYIKSTTHILVFVWVLLWLCEYK